MRKFNYISFILILVFLVANTFSSLAKGKGGSNKTGINKVNAGGTASNVVDINNITSWIGSDGFHDWVVASSWNGAFPKGSAVGAIFAEGIVWGGKVVDGQNPLIRVNGNTYGTGCQSLFNPARTFRVRPDFQTASLADDASNFFNVPLGAVTEDMINTVKANYAADWADWPANEGAPFTDADSNGVYNPDPNGNGIYGEPGEDIPGVPGAAQTIYVKYDDALSATNYASPPIGLEVQETLWAYAYSGALGNVIYKKVDMVYKGTPKSASNSHIDDMYIVQWADPDVGTSSDDYAGCDTLLNLGYAYNSKSQDATYAGIGLAPPAVGYDFLQGVSQFTGNQSDSAIFNLKWRKGYKYVNPKPMSSFIYFAAGGNWQDPTFDYQGTLQFYNLMRGQLPNGGPFPDYAADVTPFGTYLFDGDPVTGTGKIEGKSQGTDAPGDRRIMVVNGPVNIKLHDTIEVVVALVGGLATDNLTSVTAMKTNDNTAQIVFDQLFKLPTLPPPDVHVENLNNKVILDWGSNVASVNSIENFSSQGYTFEGYDIYQLQSPSAKITDPKNSVKIASFDLANGIKTIVDTVEQNGVKLGVITETGTDNGIKRYLEITKSQFRGTDQNIQPLHNGQEYYFAVVPYAYNPKPLLPFHALQSAVVIKVGIPQTAKPGVRYSSVTGDTLKAEHSQGASDGSITPIVIDPSLTTGDQYKVGFTPTPDGSAYTWSLTDVTTNTVKLTGQTNQAGDEDYRTVDGLIVKVIGPPVAVNSWKFTPSSARWFTGNAAGLEQLGGGLGVGVNFFGSSVTPSQYVTVEVRFTSDTSKGQKAYRYLRGGTPNYGFQDYKRQYFTVWDVTSNPNRQLAAAYVTQKGTLHENLPWQPTDSTSDREYLFIFNTPYTETPDTFYTSKRINSNAPEMPILYSMWPVLRSGKTFNPQDGQVFTITPNFVNTANDVFTFAAPAAVTSSNDLAKVDINKINVFPNPYYGFQYRETSRDQKYVTFSHLPAKATIRIFDLSGVLVRTLASKDPGSQFTTWDLKNDNNYPVASGVYIIHIDMPDLGATKILKLALIQEEQILKVY